MTYKATLIYRDEGGFVVSAGLDPSRAPAALFILDAENVVHDRRHWPVHECETTFTDCPTAWHERVVTVEELPDHWEACRECLSRPERSATREPGAIGSARINYGGPR